jgi:hypothetical protein
MGMEWISVDNAPKDGKKILMLRNGIVSTAWWKGDTWGGDGWSYELGENIRAGFTENLPTHWMPMLPPPKD